MQVASCGFTHYAMGIVIFSKIKKYLFVIQGKKLQEMGYGM